MARASIVKPDHIDAPVTNTIVARVTGVGSAVPSLIGDFAAHDRFNLALDADYDYRAPWCTQAPGWQPGTSPPGDDARGVRGDGATR